MIRIYVNINRMNGNETNDSMHPSILSAQTENITPTLNAIRFRRAKKSAPEFAIVR